METVSYKVNLMQRFNIHLLPARSGTRIVNLQFHTIYIQPGLILGRVAGECKVVPWREK